MPSSKESSQSAMAVDFVCLQLRLKGRTIFNLPLREHPYTGKAGEWKMKLLKWFER